MALGVERFGGIDGHVNMAALDRVAMLAAVPSLAMELGPFKIRVNTVLATWMLGPAVEG